MESGPVKHRRDLSPKASSNGLVNLPACLACVVSLSGFLLAAAILQADPPPVRLPHPGVNLPSEGKSLAGAVSVSSSVSNLLTQSAWWQHGLEVPSRELFDPSDLFHRQSASSTRLLLTQQSANLQANDDETDISEPGLDMGDYPNSAYTLKKGRVQLEMGPASFRTKNANNPSAYASPFLLRYGVTDDMEFRLIGTGITSLISPDQTTGFGVVTFDTKIHLWNDQMEYFIPAVSFEAALQTELGSPAFQAGNEPSINFNMDFPFTKKTTLEATIGYGGVLSTVNLLPIHGQDFGPAGVAVNTNIFLFSFQWALEQKLTDKFSVFVHGYYSKPVSFSGVGAVVGSGFFYQCSKRTMLFGSANAGLTDVPAPFLTQLGFGYAF